MDAQVYIQTFLKQQNMSSSFGYILPTNEVKYPVTSFGNLYTRDRRIKLKYWISMTKLGSRYLFEPTSVCITFHKYLTKSYEIPLK